MKQYSAKMLFQWRPVRNGISRKRRICEKRIVTFSASNAEEALKRVTKIGKSEEYTEQKPNGKVYFEFIGVLELKDITLNYSDGEVWSEIKEMVEPMERKDKIIPKKHELDALRKKSKSASGRLTYSWRNNR